MLWVFYGAIAFSVFLLVYPSIYMIKNRHAHAVLATLVTLALALYAGHYYCASYIKAWEYGRNIRLDHALSEIAAIHAPVELDQYLTAVKSKIQDLGVIGKADEMSHAANFVNQLLIKFGPYASNAVLYNYLKDSVQYDKSIRDDTPQLVLFHEFPEKVALADMDLTNIDTTAYIKSLFANLEPVVSSGIGREQMAPSKDDEKQAMIIFKDLVADLSKQYGAKEVVAVLENPGKLTVEPKQAASIMIDFYDKLLELGEEKTGLFLRVTYMLNAKQ